MLFGASIKISHTTGCGIVGVKEIYLDINNCSYDSGYTHKKGSVFGTYIDLIHICLKLLIFNTPFVS